LDRLGEAHALVLHEEADRGAVRAAAEAVIELLRRAHGEGRRLLVVERTAGLVVLAGPFERNARVDDFHDIRAQQHLVDELLRDPAAHGAYSKRSRRTARGGRSAAL